MIYQCPKCHLFIMAEGEQDIYCDRFGCKDAKMVIVKSAIEPKLFICECGTHFTVRYKGKKPLQRVACPNCEPDEE